MDATFATLNVTANLVTKGIGSRNRTSSGFWGENTRGSFNMRFCTVQSHKSLKVLLSSLALHKLFIHQTLTKSHW